MSKLTAKSRNALPASKFAGPDRSYPIPDKAHAADAKARAAQFASPAMKAKIDAKANKVLRAAGGALAPSPGQTVTNGSWDPSEAAKQLPMPKPDPQPSSPGQGAVNDFRAKLKAAGGRANMGGCGGSHYASGLDEAMSKHADKVHPRG